MTITTEEAERLAATYVSGARSIVATALRSLAAERDARAEGAMWHDGGTYWHSGWRHDYSDVHADAYSSFARLWNKINGPGAWDENPWVWVVSFERVKP